jgi:hypothetical protein
MRLDPSGPYQDGHFHLDIKNYEGEFTYEPINYIPTDEDFKNNSINLNGVVITAENLYPVTSLEKKIQDLLWSNVKPNEYGNSGRYNLLERTCDQYYSDTFLKWWYKGNPNNNPDNK